MDTRRSIGREKAGYREGPCDRCRSHSLSRSSRCTARPNLIRRSGCNFGEQTACQAEGSSRLPFKLRVFGRVPGAGVRGCKEAGARKASTKETTEEFAPVMPLAPKLVRS